MKPDQETTKPVFDASHIGCYFDCSRGIYIGVEVQKLALDQSWEPKDLEDLGDQKLPIQPESEFYHELIHEAINFLQSLTLDGLCWGYSEGGDFGLWLRDCEECDGHGELAVDTIAGKFKDNCPSCKGTGNELQIKL